MSIPRKPRPEVVSLLGLVVKRHSWKAASISCCNQCVQTFCCFCCFCIFVCILDFMEQESRLPLNDVGEPSVVTDHTLMKLQDAVVMAIVRVRQRILQGLTVLSFVLLLLCVAAFLYGSFYYSYMPMAAFSTPVHYYYRCDLSNLLYLCVVFFIYFFCFSYLFFPFSLLQDRLWISNFLFMLLPCSQHLLVEKQKACRYKYEHLAEDRSLITLFIGIRVILF